MKFLSLVIALLIEQARPLRKGNAVYAAFERYAELLEGHLNAGEFRQGVLAWLLAVLPPAALAAVIYALLHRLSPFIALAWSVLVLYATMGFRQFSHYYTEIQQALREGDVATARDRVNIWRGGGATEFSASEVARVAIELGLVGSHRHVFGPVAWFILLGPAGAVIYRIAALLNDDWGSRADPEFSDFARFARRCFFWLDWLPARLTAASFAVVGNFEDAVYCWRTQARSWAAKAQDVILASGGGALGVRLGDALHQYDGLELRAELGIGDDADADYMQSAVGLIWRALVLWVFLIFLVTVAHSLG
ncbi:MAG TPA: CobD/CbiB family protein [Burkholderiales bacterium]|nr:CobD/CbiB family protein [Burkholderiales bacterium]